MNYKDFNEVAKQPRLLASLATFINPAFIFPTLAIGTLAIGVVSLFKSDKKEETEESNGKELLNTDKIAIAKPSVEPLNNGNLTVQSTVKSTVNPSYVKQEQEKEKEPEPPKLSEEELQKEAIRKYMSELGKRSAEKRRQKKKEAN